MGCNHLITFFRQGISWPSVAATRAGAEMGVCGQLGMRRPAVTLWSGPPFTHNPAYLGQVDTSRVLPIAPEAVTKINPNNRICYTDVKQTVTYLSINCLANCIYLCLTHNELGAYIHLTFFSSLHM
jgi:hypothetical protein